MYSQLFWLESVVSTKTTRCTTIRRRQLDEDNSTTTTRCTTIGRHGSRDVARKLWGARRIFQPVVRVAKCPQFFFCPVTLPNCPFANLSICPFSICLFVHLSVFPFVGVIGVCTLRRLDDWLAFLFGATFECRHPNYWQAKCRQINEQLIWPILTSPLGVRFSPLGLGDSQK
jgi:hypothetical protein